MSKTIISWDLGATKCLAGVVEYNDGDDIICKRTHSLKLREAHSLEDLILRLENGLDVEMAGADAICIAAAGMYDGQSLYLENGYPYPMNFAEISAKLNWHCFSVIHDYAPIVCATFTSYMNNTTNIKRLNSSSINSHGRRVAFGIGTSLGVKDGTLLPGGDFWLGQNEMGHIGITTAPLDQYHRNRHQELIHYLSEILHNQNQPITFEKILSGSGMVRLYQFLYGDDDSISPETVGVKVKNGEASELLDMFAWYIGLFVGTLQLTFMPEGGVWITGGVALNHLNVFDRPDFFNGIDSSPAYRSQRANSPLGVLCNDQHALIGCAYYAAKRSL